MKGFTFVVTSLRDIRSYIETYHYSKSVNGLKISYCFKIVNDKNEIVGASIYGQQSTTAWKKYVENESDLLELRRLCTTDKTKNLLSKFVGFCNRYIKKHSDVKLLLSYADPYNGHVGTIYQATNWLYLGETSSDVLLRTPEGKIYHSRAMRTKYNGEFKPFAVRLQLLEQQGLLEKVQVPGKHIYVLVLNGKFNFLKKDYPKLNKENNDTTN